MYERFESRWMSVKLTCYDKTITVFFINFTTFFVGGILWWTDLVIKIYSNLYNTTTFETEIEHFLLIENIYSPELMSFDTVFE